MATLKNTTINDTGAIQLPVGTTAQRPASPSTGDMRYNTDNDSFEYYNGNEWKSSLTVVRNGLVLYLDAGNPSSYSGTGTAWYDLSGNDFHMSLKNSPNFNATDKTFELNGSNQYGSCDGTVSGSTPATVSNLGVGGNSPKTVVCVAQVREIGSTDGGMFDLGDSGSIGRHYCLRFRGSYTNWRAQFWQTPDYDFSYDGSASFTSYSVVYGADKIGRTYGNNATLLGQDDGPFDLNTAGSRPFEMGRYSGSLYGGFKIHAYLVYNRALSEAEIQQNFNAFQNRTGF